MDKENKSLLYVGLGVLALVLVCWALKMLSERRRRPQLPHIGMPSHLPKLPRLPKLPQRQPPPPPSQPDQPPSQPPAQLPEVFWVRSDNATPDMAASVCAPYGAQVATLDQLQDSFNAGSSWCTAALTTDSATTGYSYWPNDGTVPACGNVGINYQTLDQGRGVLEDSGVNCYGVKPSQDSADTSIVGGFNWNTGAWSQYSQ